MVRTLTLANGQTLGPCQVKVILEPFVASEVASCFGDQVTFVPKGNNLSWLRIQARLNGGSKPKQVFG